MRWAAFLTTAVLAMALASSCATAAEPEARSGAPPREALNTLDDIQTAFFDCWKWPPGSDGSEEHGRTMLTFTLSFRRDGTILRWGNRPAGK